MNHPNDTQVGGVHYKKATFQPWDWELYGVGGWQQSIVKYVVRYKDKNGLQDLKKALHYLEKLRFHAASGEVENNNPHMRLSLIYRFLEENQCDVHQREAIKFTLLWRDVTDINNAVVYVRALMEAIAPTQEIQIVSKPTT